MAESACEDLTRALERADALPKPPDLVGLTVASAFHGAFGNPGRGYELGAEAEARQAAIRDELSAAAAAAERLDAAHLLLPKLAERFAPAAREAPGRFEIDFDENGVGSPPGGPDWLRIGNVGEPLEDCTVLVELTGAAGETRKNVHFVAAWPAGASMHARYKPGVEFLGRMVDRTTVTRVATVAVTAWSPRLSTALEYVYAGEEEVKDTAGRLAGLRFSGRYQPFESGVLWDT